MRTFLYAVVLMSGSAALAQETVRVSVDFRGVQADASSGGHSSCSISADGRFVVFQSFATNLVPGDANGFADIYLHDRFTGETKRVSVGLGGAEPDGVSSDSYQSSISADGKLVAFLSTATNLVPRDTNGTTDLFVRDLANGSTERVDVDSAGGQANGGSSDYSLSADGRYVAFVSAADNLVPGDTNGVEDVFVHDRTTGTTIRVSVDSNGLQADDESYGPAISADDRFVVFASEAGNLVQGDGNGAEDVFVHELATGRTIRVSLGDAGQEGNGDSDFPSISADGRFVAFGSVANNLVASDGNGVRDVFVRDIVAGRTILCSVGTSGTQADQDSIFQPAISGDGRYVVFSSYAQNLDPDLGAPGHADEFLRDLQTGTTSLVDVDSAGAAGYSGGYYASMTPDGRFIGFESNSTNLVPNDGNAARDVFVRDVGSPQASRFCSGDGLVGPCPCAASGGAGRGCDNVARTGGATIVDFGAASVATDTLVLLATAEVRGAPTVLLQADAQIPPRVFGHGLRCIGGGTERLFSGNATPAGTLSLPGPADPSIAGRSAALGRPIAPGSTRYYQTTYRDTDHLNCPPVAEAWNLSSGLAILWGP